MVESYSLVSGVPAVAAIVERFRAEMEAQGIRVTGFEVGGRWDEAAAAGMAGAYATLRDLNGNPTKINGLAVTVATP